MVFIKSFVYFVLASTLAIGVQAAPWPKSSKHSTFRRRSLGKRQLLLETYHPPSRLNTYGTNGRDIPLPASPTAATTKDKAMAYVQSLGVEPAAAKWHSGYTSGSTEFAYLTQHINGIPVSNAVSNVVINKDKVSGYSTSFVDVAKAKVASSEPKVAWRDALPNIEEILDGQYNGQNVTLEYIVSAKGTVSLTHALEIQNDKSGSYYKAYIDAQTGELVSVTDYVAHASYTVIPITSIALPDGLETVVDPEDLIASPFGWHSRGRGNSSTTSGNNVFAFKDQTGASQTSAGLNFNAQYDDTLVPQTASNVDAARTNAFFVINMMHDITYRYGFTEEAFNFQLDNNGKGGLGDDRVSISIQDGSGVNNANFATPEDGRPGICRMFMWTTSEPNRDGAMSNDVIIHEMMHGVTNRMVGGGRATCLQSNLAGGLGEGWGDAVANWMQQKSAQTTDFVMAAYVDNSSKGLRQFPYSTNQAINPLTYQDLQQFDVVHTIGEVFANMMHILYAALVDARGFSENKLTDSEGVEGNIIFMRLLMGSLPRMPCNPNFVQARDAMLQADADIFGGEFRCLISSAFASRGLGALADGETFANDFTVAEGC